MNFSAKRYFLEIIGIISLLFYICSPKTVVVAQLVRVADCDSVGRGFESHQSPQFFLVALLSKYIPTTGIWTFLLHETSVNLDFLVKVSCMEQLIAILSGYRCYFVVSRGPCGDLRSGVLLHWVGNLIMIWIGKKRAAFVPSTMLQRPLQGHREASAE